MSLKPRRACPIFALRCLCPLSLMLVMAGLAPESRVLAQDPGADEPARIDPNLTVTPLAIEAFNLRFHPPRSAANPVSENLNGLFVVTLSDSAATPTWNLRVQSMKSSLPKPSPTAQIDDLLQDLDKMKAQYKVLVNEGRSIAGLDSRLCYLQRTNSDNETFISGWLVIPIAPAEFIVFAMQMVPESYSTMKEVFDACFHTIDVKTQEQVLTTRNVRLKNGHELLKTLTPQRLGELVGQKQWTRIYKPANANGQPSEEVACAMIEVLAAKRGALNPQRDEAKYSASEREDGLMVRMQGRIIVDAKRRIFYDSIALYWMAWDQSEEEWSVRGTQRQGEAEMSESETGVRAAPTTGAPKAMVSVIKRTTGSEPVSHQWETPNVYLSQALGWIAGRLLPRDITEPQDYAWYYYVGSSMQPKMYQRVDRWERGNDGNYTLTTSLTSDTPPYSSVYGSDGSFIRRVHGDGSVTEPTTLEELNRIWKSRGLPVKADDK